MSLSSGRVSTQPCLGFCGRTSYFNESESQTAQWTKCGACPWGQRANKNSLCEPCEKPLPPYDWMYLLFVALLPLLLHMQFIRNARKYCRTRSYEVAEHFCAIVENLIASIASVLIFPPRLSIFLYACEKSTYREWYPAMNNPVIEYSKSMRCSYEVVFPLYSLPFVHHLILIVSILVLRSVLYCCLLYKTYNGKPFYYALLSLPVLAAIHAFFAGFLYYSFPWTLLMGTVCAMVFHLAKEGRRTIGEMLTRLIFSPWHILFLLIAVLLLSFSLVALVTPYESPTRWMILCSVPLPFILFLFMLPFSHPTLVTLIQ